MNSSNEGNTQEYSTYTWKHTSMKHTYMLTYKNAAHIHARTYSNTENEPAQLQYRPNPPKSWICWWLLCGIFWSEQTRVLNMLISFEFTVYQPEGSIFFWNFFGIASPIVHINVFLSCWLNYLSFWFPKCRVNRLSSLLMTCVLNLFVLSTFMCLPSYFESKHFLKDIPAIFLSNDLSFV